MSSYPLNPPLNRNAASSALRQRSSVAKQPGMFLRTLVFLLGFTMPFISFAQHSRITTSLLSRIEAVDIICLLILLVLLFTSRLRLTWAFLLYGVSLVFSLAMASSINGIPGTFTAFAALSMAALYFCLARSIAEEEALVKALVAGLMLSTLIEGFIVLHDFFLPKWFQTTHADRVRGTFRSTAQLGGFGFTVAGILLSFGWVYFRSAWARWLVVIASVMGIFFVLASTRRAGMFALFAWLGLYLLMGLKQISRRSYWVVVTSAVAGFLLITVGSSLVSKTHVAERFELAFSQVASGNSFTHEQFYNAMDNLEMWFPLGVGVGQSPLVVVKHEAHNAHLGIVVEQGVLGFIAYYALWIPLLLRNWKDAFGRHSTMVKLVTLTFLASAVVFMIHARLDRDRVFMLFLGLAPYAACVATDQAKRMTRRRQRALPQPPPTVPPQPVPS